MWFFAILYDRGKTNFFEKRVGEYQKASVMSSLQEGNKNYEFKIDEDFWMKFAIDSGKGSSHSLWVTPKWEQCSRLVVVEEEETNSLKITICFGFGLLAIDVMLLLFVPSLMCNNITS